VVGLRVIGTTPVIVTLNGDQRSKWEHDPRKWGASAYWRRRRFLALGGEIRHNPVMSAQRAEWVQELDDNEMLDVDTSAALMHWMETALVPDGVEVERWKHWVYGGCKGRIEAEGIPLTPEMLGRWARTGALR
jgi:hypothetical protein